MKLKIEKEQESYEVDLNKGKDISVPMGNGRGPLAWYTQEVKISPVRSGDFIGSICEGGAVNFRNIAFNPHGNGTHTECVGHIAEEVYSVHENFSSRSFFNALLISVTPIEAEENDGIVKKGDHIINNECYDNELIKNEDIEAVLFRTLPNTEIKKNKIYSGNNPPYFLPEVLEKMRLNKIKHFLTDLPSVDREQDDGNLFSHKAYWNYPKVIDREKTITEMIYVPDEITDGQYLLNIQTVPFVNDAVPSRPLLYKIE